jgi:bifunctional non-homologous end joining protein LigD
MSDQPKNKYLYLANDMMSLLTYRSKRRFGITPEPKGRLSATRRYQRFVVQRHDARRLHFDLRLEIDGVYKSWAVTKVPSADPAVRRLAVAVEDHPIEYGKFEGVIPKGEYGAGVVTLWDRGRWQSHSANSPQRDLKKGLLKFQLRGKRMKGGWALVRLRNSGTRADRNAPQKWLLIKERDAFAKPGKPDLLARQTASIKSRWTPSEIARCARNSSTCRSKRRPQRLKKRS